MFNWDSGKTKKVATGKWNKSRAQAGDTAAPTAHFSFLCRQSHSTFISSGDHRDAAKPWGMCRCCCSCSQVASGGHKHCQYEPYLASTLCGASQPLPILQLNKLRWHLSLPAWGYTAARSLTPGEPCEIPGLDSKAEQERLPHGLHSSDTASTELCAQLLNCGITIYTGFSGDTAFKC